MPFFEDTLLGTSLVLAVLLFGIGCYQLAAYLSRPDSTWRLWQLLMLALLAAYNISDALLPDPEPELPPILQFILHYGLAFSLASYFPFYFYKAHGLGEFRYHFKIGVPICYGLTYLAVFCVLHPLTGDTQLVTNHGMLLPFLYSFVLFGVLAIGVYRKLKQQKQLHLKSNLRELYWSCTCVAPWLVVNLFVYWQVDPILKMCITNAGFVCAAIWMLASEIREKVIGQRLSEHIDSKRQLSFGMNCQLYGLTKRETEVASLLCSGLTYREVGEQLFISEHTVDNHVQHIFAKVGVKKRIELYEKLRPVIV